MNIRTGRPPWKADLSLVEKYASLGMTNQQIADCLGVNRSTLYRKKQAKKDFCNALTTGRARGIALAAQKCMEQINAGNWQMIKFYLQVHAGWAITTVIEDISPDQIRTMTTDQIRAILASTPRQA
jgi:transposase